ncbi:unnamed protein product [Symbiodinium natans]|uniref:Uncharacterized protein n=1 Tax=Symbiodinium natans TaxID=878477 RepID=A0A812HUQ2_9DINO|nr:unnamed protein product [Symbiodinium natans]
MAPPSPNQLGEPTVDVDVLMAAPAADCLGQAVDEVDQVDVDVDGVGFPGGWSRNGHRRGDRADFANEVIRAVRAHTMLLSCGRAFRGFMTNRIDEFWSHSWHTSPWAKVSTLWFVNNGYAAAAFGLISAVIAFVFGLFEVLPLRLAEGVRYPWCALFGALGYYLTLLLWRRRKKVFVDIVCIDQNDAKFTAMALLSLPAILQRSEGMLVVWDSTWASRLWCVFELAAFIHSRRTGEKMHLLIRPIVMGPALVSMTCGLVVATVAFSSNFVEGHISWQRTLGIVMIVSALCLLFCAHNVRVFCRNIDNLQKQLVDFRVENARCSCCDRCDANHIDRATGEPLRCDRKILTEVITTWFGSIESFERQVQGQVRTILLRQLVSTRFIYCHVCAGASGLLERLRLVVLPGPRSMGRGLWKCIYQSRALDRIASFGVVAGSRTDPCHFLHCCVLAAAQALQQISCSRHPPHCQHHDRAWDCLDLLGLIGAPAETRHFTARWPDLCGRDGHHRGGFVEPCVQVLSPLK